MGVGLGLTGYLGFGQETVYGTPVARVNFLEINDENMGVDEPKIESAALAQVGIRSTKVAQGMISTGGDFNFDASYAGWERLLKHVCGNIVSSRPDVTSSPTVWDHTFTIADQLPTGLTIEVFRGTETFLTEPNKAFVYAGCLISNMNISCGADDLMKIGVNVMGQQEARAAKSTPVYDNSTLAVFHQGTLKWNDSDVEAHSFSLDINNSLEMRAKLGSRLTRQPKRSGKLDVSGSFQAEFINWDQYDDFRAATNRAIVIQFIGPVIINSFSNQITITLAVSKINTYRVVLNQPGRLIVDIQFKAYRTESAGELSIVMRNTTTASLAN